VLSYSLIGTDMCWGKVYSNVPQPVNWTAPYAIQRRHIDSCPSTKVDQLLSPIPNRLHGRVDAQRNGVTSQRDRHASDSELVEQRYRTVFRTVQQTELGASENDDLGAPRHVLSESGAS